MARLPAKISHATAQGSRTEQQDRYMAARIEPGGQLLAVMDGHGGSRTAEILATHLSASVQLALKATPDDPQQALQAAIQRLAQRTAIERSGSTLSVVYIPDDHHTAFTAVLGDSPIVIVDSQGSLRMSPIHNARTNPRERAAAVARGANYSEGYLEDPQVPDHGLQMSRALGDNALARILNREPDLDKIPLGPASIVILATDGVLDSFESELEGQLKRMIKLAAEGMDADGLVKDALRRQTGDNVTVMVWKNG